MAWLGLILLLLMGCSNQPIPPTSDIQPSQAETWQLVFDGLSQQFVRHETAFFQAVRLDPNLYEFRTHYRPEAPLTIESWKAVLPDAAIIINANFYTVDNRVLGLLVSDGTYFGTPYRDRGGTFYTTDEQVDLIYNPRQNTLPANMTQAVQAFPMLVDGGQALYANVGDTTISRRTVIAQDSSGHIIMMVTAGFGISLPVLSEFLADSDLNIVSALNLDGGGSTMMHIAPTDTTIVSADPVPAVLAAYPLSRR